MAPVLRPLMNQTPEELYGSSANVTPTPKIPIITKTNGIEAFGEDLTQLHYQKALVLNLALP